MDNSMKPWFPLPLTTPWTLISKVRESLEQDLYLSSGVDEDTMDYVPYVKYTYNNDDKVTKVELFYFVDSTPDFSEHADTLVEADFTYSPNLKVLSESTFDGCTHLATLTNFPSGIERIEQRAFASCSSATFAADSFANVTEIGWQAFVGCSAASFADETFASLIDIGSGAFHGCTSATFASATFAKVERIYMQAFFDCSSATFANATFAEVSLIGIRAFMNCRAATFANATFVKAPALSGQGNTGSDASFNGCRALQSIILGSVGYPMDDLKLPWKSFFGCSNLTSITIYTEGGAALRGTPFGAFNATITYLSA